MTTKNEEKSSVNKNCDCCKKSQFSSPQSSPVYGIGVVGAAFYFLQNAQTLNEYLIGIAKSLVWPGYLVYSALDFLKILN